MFLDILVYRQIFLISLIFILMIYKFILILLIFFELIIMNIFIIIYIMIVVEEIEFNLIYIIIFRVCEGVLSLGLLINIIRFRGNDLYYLINLGKF